MAVLRPLRLVIANYPEGEVEELDALNNPEDPAMGTRKVPFSKVLYIEEDDFLESPPKKFYRLAPGREVRLRYAYFLKCVSVVKNDQTGRVEEVHCTYDPATKGGDAPDGRKVRATLHWVSATHAVPAEVRLYEHLFAKADPNETAEGFDFKANLNPKSLETLTSCMVESSLGAASPGSRFQFERMGYFCADLKDSAPGKPVFNRTATLRDEWAKIQQAEQGAAKPPEKEPFIPLGEEITIEDFSKLDLRVGVVREACLVKGADKLVKLGVDVGEGPVRQIFAGIRSGYPDPGGLVGKKVIVVANLKPRQMKFGLSEGMILAGSGKGRMGIATFDGELLPGDKVS
jgi:methionine--tRNA ligase beta chain